MSNKKAQSSKNKGKHRVTKRKNKIKKSTSIILCIVFVILLGGVGFNIYSLYQNGGVRDRVKEAPYDVTVSIQKGTLPKSISKALKEAGIVDNSTFFYLKAKKDGSAQKFQYGDFTFNKKMDYNQIVETLQKAPLNENLVLLVKEGQTQEDIAKTLDEKGIVSYESFMKACNEASFDYDFLKDLPTSPERKSRLEGYLYPDTYYLSEEETPESIINKLLSRFNELYTEDMTNKAKEMGLTTDQVVTIASIIEREVKYAPEKSTVASVVFNRLNQGIKLQMDATVLYAKNEHSDRTLISDTKIESPYNTYYVDGLPIGPISNPSIDTIKAVLNPDNTDYLYYVLKDDTTGEHFFTSSYDEFLKAKEQYVKKFN